MGRRTLFILVVACGVALTLVAMLRKPSPKLVIAFTGYRPSAVTEYSYAEFNISNLSTVRIDTFTTGFEDQNGVRTNGYFLFKDFIKNNPSIGFQSQVILVNHGTSSPIETRLFLAPGSVAQCRIPTNLLTGMRRISISYIRRQTNLVDATDDVLVKLLRYVGVKKNKRFKVEAVWCDVPGGESNATMAITNSLSR